MRTRWVYSCIRGAAFIQPLGLPAHLPSNNFGGSCCSRCRAGPATSTSTFAGGVGFIRTASPTFVTLTSTPRRAARPTVAADYLMLVGRHSADLVLIGTPVIYAFDPILALNPSIAIVSRYSSAFVAGSAPRSFLCTWWHRVCMDARSVDKKRRGSWQRWSFGMHM